MLLCWSAPERCFPSLGEVGTSQHGRQQSKLLLAVGTCFLAPARTADVPLVMVVGFAESAAAVRFQGCTILISHRCILNALFAGVVAGVVVLDLAGVKEGGVLFCVLFCYPQWASGRPVFVKHC